MDKKFYATLIANLGSLRAAIPKEWNAYPAAGIISACKSFRHRIEAVIDADGSYIEN